MADGSFTYKIDYKTYSEFFDPEATYKDRSRGHETARFLALMACGMVLLIIPAMSMQSGIYDYQIPAILSPGTTFPTPAWGFMILGAIVMLFAASRGGRVGEATSMMQLLNDPTNLQINLSRKKYLYPRHFQYIALLKHHPLRDQDAHNVIPFVRLLSEETETATKSVKGPEGKYMRVDYQKRVHTGDARRNSIRKIRKTMLVDGMIARDSDGNPAYKPWRFELVNVPEAKGPMKHIKMVPMDYKADIEKSLGNLFNGMLYFEYRRMVKMRHRNNPK